VSFRSSMPDRLRDQRPETGSIPGSSTERAAGERPFLFGLPCRISTPIKIRANPVADVVRLSFWSHTATFAVLASEPCPAPLRPLGPSVPGRCAPIGGQLTCAHSRRSGPLHKWLLDGPARPWLPRTSAPAPKPIVSTRKMPKTEPLQQISRARDPWRRNKREDAAILLCASVA
jgi:hypothetical protein